MTEAKFYNKVTWITFIFGVLVVMIHGNNIALFLNGGGTGAFDGAVINLESIISEAAPITAVTGFFIISAYLFFRNIDQSDILPKMIRRVGTVLVPYIVWNTLYYLLFALGSRFTGLWGVLGIDGYIPLSFGGWADAIINYTHNPVLWYLQQLIILIAIAPVVYVVISRAWLGIISMIIMFYVISKGIIMPVLNLDALLYYCFGAFLAIHCPALVEYGERGYRGYRKRKKKMWIKAAMVLAGLLASVCLYRASVRCGSIFLTVVFAILSPSIIWLALPADLPKAGAFMKCSLFLYCFHFLPVRAINKIGALVLPHNGVTALLLYLILPVIVVMLTWGLAELFKKKIPPLWKLLSGGR